ncbi:MAG TPA: NAD+ synthase [Thermoanaerobaculia bacterium]|nr:NAD+ synthase [Thermoanaerobaculia bacterium]HUM30182.1 NAD+ synthase [Thermoanaerobaculia bacterium]HXK68369.1 NAD+ synthase [Thermoanaerobaculia bacterium]
MIRLALAQINPTLGDIEGNKIRILDSISRARDAGSDIVAFPELCITGYPPEDLLLRRDFIRRQEEAVEEIALRIESFAVILGFAHLKDGKLFNGAAILNRGAVAGVYHKIFLPNYGVFDEKRYFEAGDRIVVMDWQGITIGINICEDIWIPGGVTEEQGFLGDAEIVVNISSSPFHHTKWLERLSMLSSRASTIRGAVGYVNLVGGQDELVFDGNSLVVNHEGNPLTKGLQFREDLLLADIDIEAIRSSRSDPAFRRDREAWTGRWPLQVVKIDLEHSSTLPEIPSRTEETQSPNPAEEVYEALVLGTRDYIEKNRFKDVIIGISGGIDSALTAAIAVDALGCHRVHGVSMPSPFTSSHSIEDAEVLARNLDFDLSTIPITEPYQSILQTMKPEFGEKPEDITEENLQARIRGMILMALSNKHGYLVLTTGNKSEVSVGYSTLYGDTAGGFAVIKDLYKTMVYRVARWRNEAAERAFIPPRILTKAPSAELKPDQTDQDTLPPYDVLDAILIAYIEQQLPIEEIVQKGLDRELVQRVIRMVDRAEYKRRQSPPGIKITPLAFGKDRRMPITNRWDPTRG